MSLAQFLTQIGGALGGPPNPMGMGGMGGDQLETPFAMQQMQPQQAMQQKKPGGGLLSFLGKPDTRDALGQIGDYLLQANDMAPIYGPRKARREQERVGSLLGQYLGQGDEVLAQIMSADPQTGMALLKMKAEQQKGQEPDVTVIDGVAFDKRTGTPLFESPYDRIIPGPEGSFYRVPRMGLGRVVGGAQQPQQPAQPAPQGEDAAAPIIAQATRSKVITPEDYTAIQQSLGPNGRKAADQWRQQNGIQIGRVVNGKKYVQRNGEWYEAQ